MIYSIDIYKDNHLISLFKIKPSQAIISFRDFSKRGDILINESQKIYNQCKNNNIEFIFNWDKLHLQSEFDVNINKIPNFISKNNIRVRIQDPGVFQYCLDQNISNLELDLSWGNHNLINILNWTEYAGSKLVKIIISSQLTYESIKEICTKVKCEVEILGLGRPLIFYSPRSLLKSILNKEQQVDELVEAWADGEETSHQNFLLQESNSGTLMYNSKVISLIDEIELLSQIKNIVFRIDSELIDENFNLNDLKAISLKINTIKGFYKTNKTDVLFKKLKNSFLINQKDEQFAVVTDTQSKKYLILEMIKDKCLNVNDSIVIYTPDKKIKNYTITVIKDLYLNQVLSSREMTHILIPHISGVSNKSIVCKKNN